MKNKNVFETSDGPAEIQPRLISVSDIKAAFIKAFTEFPMLQVLIGNSMMEKFCGRVMGILFIEVEETSL